MRFLFLYPDVTYTNQNRFHKGIAYLSSALKLQGHDVSLMRIFSIGEKDKFLEQVKEYEPDLIGYSSISYQAPVVKKLAQWSKELGIFTIWGGVHPTLDPDESLKVDGIDAVCLGEADLVLPDFVSIFSKGGSIDKVKSFYIKLKNGKFAKSEVAPLPENLDELPFPDYDLFPYDKTDDYTIYDKAITVQAGRGCSFNCSYCANNALRKIYPNGDKYSRTRSVDNVISEIKMLLQKYPQAAHVRFSDDTLSSSSKWFSEFTEKYSREVGLPYSTNERAEFVTEEKALSYRQGGCISVDMGIESGNFYIRNTIMNRKVKDEVIIRAFSLMRQQGIKANAFNILGMPYETVASALDTVKLNAKCRPALCFNAYFHPFISTDAYLLSKRLHLIDDAFVLPTILAENPVLRLPTITYGDLKFFYKYFTILVFLYKLLFKFSPSSGKLVRLIDRILTSKFFPRKLLSSIYLTKFEIKRKFPVLSRYLVKIKRRFTSSYIK